MSYSVNYWGSHPRYNNDDCWSGKDFDTLREAVTCFYTPASKVFKTMSMNDAEYIELDGPGQYDVRRNEEFLAPAVSLDDWQAEIAREEGMLNGVESYNDHMAY